MTTQVNKFNDTLKNNKIDDLEANQEQKLKTTTAFTASTEAVQNPADINPQVKPAKPYTPRRSYNRAYKERVLATFEACASASERSAFLRREGLYYSRICAWRNELSQPKLKNKSDKKTPRTDHLMAENAQLKKKLAQAEAIIDLQKKVSELFGLHTHQINLNEVS